MRSSGLRARSDRTGTRNVDARDRAVRPRESTRKIPKDVYRAELFHLQTEFVRLQEWARETGARIVIVFEGRDAAGKGGTIKRITEYLSPRVARIAALPAPTERERGAVVLPALCRAPAGAG